MIDTLLSYLELDPTLCFKRQKVHTPGKLYIAGEYAVLTASKPAIIMAVNQYLTCEIALHVALDSVSGTISTELADMTPLHYIRKNSHSMMEFDLSNNGQIGWQYVTSTIQVVERFLLELKRPLQNIRLHFTSDMVDESGQKYGFGSSGAVVVSTIQAMLQFYGLKPKATLVYKLAVIAMLNIESPGSFGDLAAIANKGVTYYSAPNRDWVKTQLSVSQALIPLLIESWPDFIMTSLPIPPNLQIIIGWTQSPASTDHMISELKNKRMQHDKTYQEFLIKAEHIVNEMKIGFETNNVLRIQSLLADYRFALLSLAAQYQLNIETPQLQQFVELAQAYQFEAKSSGAGGGDCGIAIGTRGERTKELEKAWLKAGIIALPFNIALHHESVDREEPQNDLVK